MILNLIACMLLALTGIASLGLNFATQQAPPGYRKALYLMSTANLTSVAFVYYEQVNNLLAIILPSVALIYAIWVSGKERVGTLSKLQRQAILQSGSFRLVIAFCASGVVLLLIALGSTGWHYKAPTPIEDAADSLTELTLPASPAELRDRHTLDSLNAQNP